MAGCVMMTQIRGRVDKARPDEQIGGRWDVT
jgi:hypothetical protein